MSRSILLFQATHSLTRSKLIVSAITTTLNMITVHNELDERERDGCLASPTAIDTNDNAPDSRKYTHRRSHSPPTCRARYAIASRASVSYRGIKYICRGHI